MTSNAAIKAGDRVRVIRVPEQVKGMPHGTVHLFQQCVGKTFPVAGIGSCGHLEIVAADEISGAFRGRSDTIWIEPECVELVGGK